MSKKHIVISVPGYEDYSSTSKQEELVKYLDDGWEIRYLNRYGAGGSEQSTCVGGVQYVLQKEMF